jgi:hypothetical protein
MRIRTGASQKQQPATTETLFDTLYKQIQTTGIHDETIKQIRTLSQQQANKISQHLQSDDKETYDPFLLLLMLLILNKDSKWKNFLKTITKDRLWEFYKQFINPTTYEPQIKKSLNSEYFEIIFKEWLEENPENPENFTTQQLKKINKSLSEYRQKLMEKEAWILLGDLYDKIEKSGIRSDIIDQINRLSPDQKKYIQYYIYSILVEGRFKSDEIQNYYILVILYYIINSTLESLHEFMKKYKIDRLLEFYRRFINPETIEPSIKHSLDIPLNSKYFRMVLKEWLKVNNKYLSLSQKIRLLPIEIQVSDQESKTRIKKDINKLLNNPDVYRQDKIKLKQMDIQLQPADSKQKKQMDIQLQPADSKQKKQMELKTMLEEGLEANNHYYLRYIFGL